MNTIRAVFCMLAFWAGSAVAQPPQVVTDIAPVQSLAARVMEGAGSPSVILRPGESPHRRALRPSEAAALAGADLVLWIGPELMPWFESTLDRLAPDARQIALLDHADTLRRPVRDGALFAGEEAEDAHDGTDPHAWLDPANARAWLPLIAEALATLDPDNATLYRQNAKDGAAEIAALEDRIAVQLARFGSTGFLVSHDAFQYFEFRFGTFANGALSGSDDQPPSAARLKTLRDAVAEAGISCVLAEPQTDPRLLETVLPGSETRVARIDLMGSGLPAGAGLYPALIGGLAQTLADCLAGS